MVAYWCTVTLLFVTQLLMDVARHKNSVPLPLIKPFTGPKLPPDRYCLTAPNYRLKSHRKVRWLVQKIIVCFFIIFWWLKHECNICIIRLPNHRWEVFCFTCPFLSLCHHYSGTGGILCLGCPGMHEHMLKVC